MDIKTFASKLFEARQVAHQAHLQTRSYATHVALNSFYDEIVDLADSFIETYQGEYGLITEYNVVIPMIKPDAIIAYLENAVEIFKSVHSVIDPKDSHLHNIVDEIVQLTYSTLYKLKFLSFF